MRFYSFSLEKPVHYFMSGEFSSQKKWIHQKRYHKGDYEIILCIRGPLYLQINNQQFTITDNTFLLVPPYTKMVGFQPSLKPVDFYWLHFFPQGNVKSYDENIPDFVNTFSNFENHVTIPMIFHINHPESISIRFHQAISTRKDSCPVQKCDFITSTLLIDLFEDFYNGISDNSDHSHLRYIQEYITTNMSSTLTVESVAEGVHLNRNYLTRLFKKYLNMTTNQYITKLKLEVASLLLLRTDMPIKEIASKSFFSSPRVFMRRFKLVNGLSPSKYRQKFRNINKNTADVSPYIPIPADIANLINDGASEKPS